MMDATGWQWAAGLSSLGFYLFLAVWVAARIWSRTKEKLAIQETLQRLIQDGTQLSPEVVDALRRTNPKRSIADILTRARKFRYWGIFLVALGILMSLYGLRHSASPIKDLRELSGGAIVLFVIPGLFCIAHSIITMLVHRPGKG